MKTYLQPQYINKCSISCTFLGIYLWLLKPFFSEGEEDLDSEIPTLKNTLLVIAINLTVRKPLIIVSRT